MAVKLVSMGPFKGEGGKQEKSISMEVDSEPVEACESRRNIGITMII